ncbi:MAG: TIM barrel protein [Thermoplasmatota archaeon]
MIRFGPSGIPLSCKGRTLLDGVKDVHKLGLSAIEVQFLRMKVRTRPVEEDYIDKKARDIEDKFIIGVNRGTDYKKIRVDDFDKVLEPGDMIHFIRGGVAEEFYRFPKIGRVAKELDVKVALHTPYYMKFTNTEGEIVEKSKFGLKYSSAMASELDSDLVVTHLGLKEDDMDDDEISDAVIENIRDIRNWITDTYGDGPKIGIEIQAGEDVYGSLDEVLDVCSKVSGTIPVINFAHIKASEQYELEEEEDFAEIFDMCKNFVSDGYYVNFSGVEQRRGEYRFTPIKRGELRFDPLVEYLINTDDNVTVISGSPLKEHDAMYMKVIFERIYSKKIAKELRRKKKDGE